MPRKNKHKLSIDEYRNLIGTGSPKRHQKTDEQLVLAMRVAHSAFVATIKEAERAGLLTYIRDNCGDDVYVEGITVNATRVIAPRA